MQCFKPVTIKSVGGRSTWKVVPCGKCPACLTNRRCDWSFRILQELKVSKSAWFITLTYDDEMYKRLHPDEVSVPMQLHKDDIQRFLKRLRKFLSLKDENINLGSDVSKKQPKNANLRYFIAGEYGPETLRPHYHGIFFNIPKGKEHLVEKAWSYKIPIKDGKKKRFQIGFTKYGDVTIASIHYVSGYIMSKDIAPNDSSQKPFTMMSTHPAIGSNYVATHSTYHKDTKHFYSTVIGGGKVRMPRLYKDKIFNQHEKDMNYENNLERIYNDSVRLAQSGVDWETYNRDLIEQRKQEIEKINKRLTKNKKL